MVLCWDIVDQTGVGSHEMYQKGVKSFTIFQNAVLEYFHKKCTVDNVYTIVGWFRFPRESLRKHIKFRFLRRNKTTDQIEAQVCPLSPMQKLKLSMLRSWQFSINNHGNNQWEYYVENMHKLQTEHHNQSDEEEEYLMFQREWWLCVYPVIQLLHSPHSFSTSFYISYYSCTMKKSILRN